MKARALTLVSLGAVIYIAAVWTGFRYVWLPLFDTADTVVVEDGAGILTPEQTRFIHRYHDKLLEDHDIDYRTVTGTEDMGADINAFAYSYFEGHGVGRRSRSGRGLLLVIDVDDGLVRLEVSRALEGVYTDAFISYVQHRQMIPFFQTGRVADGILASTELVFTRAQAARDDQAFVAPMESGTGGAGAVNDAEIGAGGSSRFREGPEVAPAGDDPRAVLAAYKEAMAQRNGNPELAIYTRETRRFLGQWTVTPAQMDNTAKSLAQCPRGTLAVDAGHAVMHYPVSMRACPPYFFRIDDGQWRLDLAAMSEAIRFNHRNQWHFARGYLDTDPPYSFAFSDWGIDQHGFPTASRNIDPPPEQD